MKVLMLFHTLTYPPESGVTKRTYHLLEEMARRHEVTVLSMGSPLHEQRIRARLGARCKEVVFVDGRRPRWVNLLRRIWRVLTRQSVLFHSHTPKIQRELDRLLGAREFDLVLLGTPVFSEYRRAAAIPCVTDTHNVEYDMCYRTYQQARGLLARAYYLDQYRLLRRDELLGCGQGEALLTTSERDKTVFQKDLPQQKIHVVPNGVDLDYFQPGAEPPAPRTMVFCGLMGYPPNDEGMTWFLDRVHPLVLREVPDAKLTIVGSGPSRALLRRASDRVRVTGYVEDVRPYVAQGQVYVVPLLVGGGTRLKALEAMAMRKAIVTTSVGCEGIDLVHERSALFADDPEAFAREVVRLFRDDALRDRIAASAAALATAKYGWSAIGDTLDGICRGVVGQARAAPAPQRPAAGARR